MELSPDGGQDGGSFRLRPFALPAGERTFQFLTGWISRLLRIGGWQPSGADPSEIPRSDLRPLRFPGATAHLGGAGPISPREDVARDEPLAR